MAELAPHQQRMVGELEELLTKLKKLTAFINSPQFNEIHFTDQELMLNQRKFMAGYASALEARIHKATGVRKYTCHKQVLARPMTRGEYITLRNWVLPNDEDPNDAGYLVEYLDGGSPNHQDFQNYISWSPKDVFERGYSETL